MGDQRGDIWVIREKAVNATIRSAFFAAMCQLGKLIKQALGGRALFQSQEERNRQSHSRAFRVHPG